MLRAIVFLAFATLAGPALAGPDTIVDVSPITGPIIQLAGAVIGILGTWALGMLLKKLKVDVDAEKAATLRAALDAAVKFGMNKVSGAVAGKPLTVDVSVPVLAQALNYAITRVPDAISHFGLTPEKLADMLVARLPAVDGELKAANVEHAVDIAATIRAADKVKGL